MKDTERNFVLTAAFMVFVFVEALAILTNARTGIAIHVALMFIVKYGSLWLSAAFASSGYFAATKEDSSLRKVIATFVVAALAAYIFGQIDMDFAYGIQEFLPSLMQ